MKTQLTSRLRDSDNWVPSMSESFTNCIFGNSSNLAPLGYGESLAIVLNNVIIAPIVLLLFLGRPLTVGLAVISIIIFPINRAIGRGFFAHVFGELPKVVPFGAYLYPSKSISLPLGRAWVVASVVDMLPRLVERVGTWGLRPRRVSGIQNFSHSESFSLSVSTIPQQRTAAWCVNF